MHKQILNSYITENAIRVHYNDQPSNLVQGNNSCLLSGLCDTHKCIVEENADCLNVRAFSL